MGSHYHLVIGLALAAAVLAVPKDAARQLEEARGNRLRKAIVPLLIGIVLKASTLVPFKLMIMTFVVVLALTASKIGLLLAAGIGLAQYYHSHGSGGSSGSSGITGYSSNLGPILLSDPTFASIPSAPSSQLSGSSVGDQQHGSQSGPVPYVRRVHHVYGR